MFKAIMKLKYTQQETEYIHYSTGLYSYKDIDSIYSKYSARGKYIYKLDLLHTIRNIFSKETIDSYRDIILSLLHEGTYTPEQLSGFMLGLIEKDEVFGDAVNLMFHECPNDKTLYEFIIFYITKSIGESISKFDRIFSNSSASTIYESNCYLYFSIDRDTTKQPDLGEIEVEVLYGKDWESVS